MSLPIYGQPIAADTGTDAPVRTLEQTQQPQSTNTPPLYVPPFNITGDDDGFPLPQTAAQAASNPLGITSDDEGYPLPGSGFGIGSDNDDNTNGATTAQILNASASGPVTAQPNVLDQYASYTYSLSWYILTPDQFNELANGEVNMNKWMLLMQSGGAQANVNDNGNGGRSPYFTLDYYMDNLILETNMPGGGMGGTLNANLGGKLEFTVTEPNGLTLPNNLALAYQDALKSSSGDQQANYAQALYCMVIRFYGYDDAGNLVQAGRNGNQNGTSSAAPPRANVQKIYPFAIQQFDFRLANRIVEYKIQATCPIFTLNASSRRGSIPQQFELVGKTVGDILAGNGSTGTNVFVPAADGRTPTATVKKAPYVPDSPAAANSRDGITASIFTGGAYNTETGAVGYAPEHNMPGASTRAGILAAQNNSVAPSNNGRGSPGVRQLDSSWDDNSTITGQAPAKADAAPSGNTTTVFTGLCDAINEFQQSLVKPGGYEIADVYEIQFAPAALADSTVALEGTAYKATPTAQQKTPSAQLNQETQRMDTTGRIIQVGLGTQIVQFIDQVMRSSSYITDQSNFIIDESTGQLKPKPSAPADASMSWYKISFQAESLGWDKGRNDYAYKMIYTITPYAINRMDSQYFPEGRYRGVHKSYNYWFTGKNNSVLNFEQEYNNMYFTILSQTAGGTGTGPIAGLTNLPNTPANEPIGKTVSNSSIPKSYAPAASQNNQGAANGANELGASAADYLYAMSPQGEIKLRIIGDPAWIPQGEITNSVNAQSFTFAPFLPDGTINVDASEIMFDIYFNRPSDYNFNTGVVNVNGQTINPGGTLAALQPQAHLTYTCTGVKSFFMQGKFEQELTGKAYIDGFAQAIQKSADQQAGREQNTNDVATAAGTRDSSIKPIDQLNPDLWDSEPSTPAGDINNRPTQPAAPVEPPTSNGDINPVTTALRDGRITADQAQQLNTSTQQMAPGDE